MKENDIVKAGSPLYELDTDPLRASLKTQLAVIASSRAALRRAEQSPRPEDIPPLEAQISAQQARVERLKRHLDRLSGVSDPRAVSQDQLTNQQLEVSEAQAQLKKLQADLAHLRAGTWQFELEELRQQVRVAEAKAEEIRVMLAQSIVRAPVPGKVLQVNVRPGEYVSPTAPEPSVLLASNGPLQVRVDIDEVNAAQVRAGMEAIASLKGTSSLRIPLRFKRVEPFMSPKRSLTGDTAERHDVRVLQVLYEFDPPPFPVYVGQQVTVYLKEGRS